MKKYKAIGLLIFLGAFWLSAKGEENYFPFGVFGIGHRGNASSTHEESCFVNLGLNFMVGCTRGVGTKPGGYEDTLLSICDRNGMKLCAGSDPDMPEGSQLYRWDELWKVFNSFHRDANDAGYHHSWTATVTGPGNWSPTWQQRVDSCLTSMRNHYSSHPSFFGYLAMHENNLRNCDTCNQAAEYICQWIKQNDPNHKSMAVDAIAIMIGDPILYPGTPDTNRSFFDSIPDLLDIFLNEVPQDTNSSWPSGSDSFQWKFDRVARACDDADSVLHNRHTQWYAHFRYDRDFSFGKELYRRKTIYELSCLPWIAISRGAKGISYFAYFSTMKHGHPNNTKRDDWEGFVDDSLRNPYARPYYSDDTSYTTWQIVHRDFRILEPVLAQMGFDKATSVKTPYSDSIWDIGLNGSRCNVKKIEWTRPPPVSSLDSLYAELGLFKADVVDPVDTGNTLRRDYINIVNRHTSGAGDSVKFALYIDNDSFQTSTSHPLWWVVDLRKWMFTYLKSVTGQNLWKFDHNGWTYFEEDWYKYKYNLPPVGPGEGKLYAIVDDPRLWDIAGTVRVFATPGPKIKYDWTDWLIFSIKTWARGELFKNGPRRKDVDSVKTVFSLVLPNAIHPIDSIIRHVSLMNWDCWDNPESQDSCYKDSFFAIKPFATWKVRISVYRDTEYIGCPVYYIGTKPTAQSKFSKMTAYPAQNQVRDPEGVFHIVYTGGADTTMILYARYNPNDSFEAVPESLYTGSFPKPETIGVGKYPAIVVKHGTTKDTLGVAWLSLDGKAIYYSAKLDSQWYGPYCLKSVQTGCLSVPRLALGLGDTVYFTYVRKYISPLKLNLVCGKFPILNSQNNTSGTVAEWSYSGSVFDPIDSLGAAIGTDYNGRPHLAWLQDTILFYAVPHDTTFRIVKLYSARTGLGEPMSLLCDPYTLNTSVVWPLGNNLMRSYFYVEDTNKIFQDTVRQGSYTIKQISAKSGFAAWKENDQLYLNLWDAVNRAWSTPETLNTDSLEGFYTQTEANQFVNNTNDLSPARYVIWTEKASDTNYWLNGEIKKYDNLGEYGIMPAAYLKLGQTRPTPFTVYRDSILSFGNEEYKQVDVGYDSLVYHLPRVNPNDNGRIFIESYFDSGDTTGSCLFRLVVNDTIVRDSIVLYSQQLLRTTEFLPDGLMQAGQLTIKLIKLSGDYVPCSRIILTTFEQDLTVRTGGGPQSEKQQSLPKTFKLYQNMPNPFSKMTTIRYALPIMTKVSLKIYDVTGRQVRKLVDGDQEPGIYTVTWDGKDDRSQSLASGVYFYRFETKEFKSTKKVVQLK